MTGRSSQPEHHPSLWQRMTAWVARSGHQPADRPPRLIRVWDAARGAYRAVDLNDRYDSLWSAANELAQLRDRETGRPAA